MRIHIWHKATLYESYLMLVGFFVKWYINLHGLFNAEAIFLEKKIVVSFELFLHMS